MRLITVPCCICHRIDCLKPDTHYPFERAVWTGRSNG